MHSHLNDAMCAEYQQCFSICIACISTNLVRIISCKDTDEPVLLVGEQVLEDQLQGTSRDDNEVRHSYTNACERDLRILPAHLTCYAIQFIVAYLLLKQTDANHKHTSAKHVATSR